MELHKPLYRNPDVFWADKLMPVHLTQTVGGTAKDRTFIGIIDFLLALSLSLAPSLHSHNACIDRLSGLHSPHRRLSTWPSWYGNKKTSKQNNQVRFVVVAPSTPHSPPLSYRR